ncbi:quinoprotein relay system zinc metallohydrolase 1 [Poseidonibacter lekithochrous]|uniref:quinoprotein relay system zinc metallohydrolase 1 n=1 Tax=Poseidonibacter TaxID=2321187 RepID=UPI001C085EAA|nr:MULTISPECIES: quinoprotein relay system zinc metallohydrolase 1 [Poseidonibacter]MBU3014153.1 quinoprotein relay system zinc metallohydrolase 1 [Poseidonibacter lekithochrous]MDO6827451.1 quinoprotein relay system zinc metallohydrolase 1 [Poseidonibacter sp. 1_MG-2023]
MKFFNQLLFLSLFSTVLFANDYNYNLKPEKIAENTYVFIGKKEFFNVKNGGDISNSAFIVTQDGVIVIDTGSSSKYGEQMLKSIRTITSKPIVTVINTHHHPDHFLGNSAFKDSEILATKYTKKDIVDNGDLYIGNLFNLTYKWMQDTKLKAPTKELDELKDKYINLGKHKLKVIYLEGHTSSDIALYDEYTKTLFASDLIFYNRVAATPHANIENWIKALEDLRKVDFKVLVPGHGPISTGRESIDQMKRYLIYLDKTLKDSAEQGLSVYEILQLPKPVEFANLAMIEDEFERSVINLYPKYENALMK